MRYLLGILSEDDRARIEDAFFADDAKFDELELLEDELIDDYVREELSPDERRQFEAKLQTSPRLVERVHFARVLAEKANAFSRAEAADLLKAASPIPAAAKPRVRWWESFFPQQRAFRMAIAACLALLVVGGGALVADWLRLRRASERINSERAMLQRQKDDLDRQLSAQQAQADQQNAELQRERDQRIEDLKLIEELQRAAQSKEQTPLLPSLSTFATIFLTPGRVRSGGAGPAQLIIGPETKTARLQLALEKNDYPTYNATIESADGTEIFRSHGLRAHATRSGPQLLLSVPSRLLDANGDYIIHVDGLPTSGQPENFNDYQFRVTRKAVRKPLSD